MSFSSFYVSLGFFYGRAKRISVYRGADCRGDAAIRQENASLLLLCGVGSELWKVWGCGGCLNAVRVCETEE